MGGAHRTRGPLGRPQRRVRFLFGRGYTEFLLYGLEMGVRDFRFGENIKEVGIKNLIVTNGASEYWIRGNTIFDQNIP